MALKSNAIVDVDDFLLSIGLTKNDIRAPVLNIYNASDDCTDATITKLYDTLTLEVVGGENAHLTSIDLKNNDSDTVGKLASKIMSLNKNWIVNVIGIDDTLSLDLYNLQKKSVKGDLMELTLMCFNRMMIERCINTASDFAEQYCRRKFIKQKHTEYISGNNSNYLRLKNYPVDIDDITINQYDAYLKEDICDIDYFVLDEDSGMIYSDCKWERGIRNYKVVYTAGYDFADIPFDLKNACLELAKYLYLNRDKQGISSVSDGVGTTSYDRQKEVVAGVPIPTSIIAMFIPYVRLDVV